MNLSSINRLQIYLCIDITIKVEFASSAETLEANLTAFRHGKVNSAAATVGPGSRACTATAAGRERGREGAGLPCIHTCGFAGREWLDRYKSE